MRKRITTLLILIGLLGSSATPAAPAEVARQPNILVFLVDDMGYGDLGSYGHPFMITPNIDRLAAEGMRFTDFHSGSAICSPSRAALLTGRNPFRLGIWQNAGRQSYVQDSEITIAEVLRRQGYQTFFAGKWHLSSISNKDQPNPGQQGFEKWRARGSLPSGIRPGGEPLTFENGASCDTIVAHSVDALKNRDPEKPFFMHLCIREPHTPLTPPRRYMDLYDNERVRRLERFVQYGRVLRPAYLDLEENPSELARYYYGTVTQIDDAFGRLMEALDKLNVRDNTLVVFTSDNGCEHPVTRRNSERDRSWGTPGEFRGMKRFLYEGGHRVPGIMRWPGVIEAGSVADATVSFVDFLPTFCEIVGAELPQVTLDGTNILPVLRGEPYVREKPIYWNMIFTHAPNMLMRLGKYSLMGYLSPIREGETEQDWVKRAKLGSFELYNLQDDPRQEVDLKETELAVFLLMKHRMELMWDDVIASSPTWPDYKGRTRPINEGVQTGVPGAIR